MASVNAATTVGQAADTAGGDDGTITRATEDNENGTTTPTASSTSSTSLSPPVLLSDPLDVAVRYVKKDRLHPVSFGKHLPITARGIREGRIDYKKYCAFMVDSLLQEEIRKDPRIFWMPSVIQLHETPLKLLVVLFSNYAFLPDWFNQEGYGSSSSAAAAAADIEDIRMKVCQKIYNSISENFNLQGGLDAFKAEVMEKLFRRSCVECADMIDREVFGGARGSFLKYCPLINDRRLFWAVAIYIRDHYSKFVSKFSLLLFTALGVRDGNHEAETTCWECGELTESNDCCCGGCELVAYCSHECQSKAWKGGHKDKCSHLQTLYQACEESFKAIDTRYEGKKQGDSRPVFHGIQLNHGIDCHVARCLHSLTAVYNNFPECLGPPSMDVFYENLGKVAQGEWWIWPLSTTGSLAMYKTKFVEPEQGDRDYFTFLACRLFFNCRADIEAYHEFFNDKMLGATGISIPMPAERFLEIYQGEDHQTDDPQHRSLEHRMELGVVLAIFRHNLHK